MFVCVTVCLSVYRNPDTNHNPKADHNLYISLYQVIQKDTPVDDNWGNITLGDDIDEAGDPPRLGLGLGSGLR
jgi:hypothetical protein